MTRLHTRAILAFSLFLLNHDGHAAMSDLDQKPPAKKARTGDDSGVSPERRSEEIEEASVLVTRRREPRCVPLRNVLPGGVTFNVECDLDRFRPGETLSSFTKRSLLFPCSANERYAFECENKQNELLEALARAVFAGRLDFIRNVFEDKELSMMATSVIRHAAARPRPICKPADVKVYHPLNGRFGNKTSDGMTVPLLIHACELGHFDIVQYLVEQGANINVWCGRDKAEYSADYRGFDDRTPLLAACRSGFEDIAIYLIKKGAVLTPQETKVTKTRSSIVSKWYGNDVRLDTPITWAVGHGLFDTVYTLIEHGVFCAHKALPVFDCAAGRERKERFDSKSHERKVNLLVNWSNRAAVVETFDSMTRLLGDPDVEDSKYFAQARMLEILGQAGLSLFGLFEKVYEEMEEQSKEKESLTGFVMRRPHTSNGKLRPHVISIIRGCRYVRSPQCEYETNRSVGMHSGNNQVWFSRDQKRLAWEELVRKVTDWNVEGDEAWRKPLKDIILSAAKPWSRANHHLFPEIARKKALEFDGLGPRIERSLNATGDIEMGSIVSTIWESKIFPFLLG